MAMENKFSEILSCSKIRNEILSAFPSFQEGPIQQELVRRHWICAALDDKQLFDEDAEGLSCALIDLGVEKIFGAWVPELTNKKDFNVSVFGVSKDAIEKMQHPDSRIDYVDSFIFSEYPLRFLIARPDTCQDLLYLMGPEKFVNRAARSYGWQPINEETLDVHLRLLYRAGKSKDGILRFLAAQKISTSRAIEAIKDLYNIDIGEAKIFLGDSRWWKNNNQVLFDGDEN